MKDFMKKSIDISGLFLEDLATGLMDKGWTPKLESFAGSKDFS